MCLGRGLSLPEAWFSWMFLLVKKEFFLPTVAKCRVSSDGWSVLCIIVGPLPFSKSCLDTNVVVKWHHRNEIEFNYFKHLCRQTSCVFT